MKLAKKTTKKIICLIIVSCSTALPFLATTANAADISGITGRAVTQLPKSNLPVSKKINNLPVKSPFPKLDQLAKETARLESIAKDPLSALPQSLAILDRLGNAVFKEVAVENGHRAIDKEWLLLADDDELQLLEKLQIEIISQQNYPSLGLQMVRFKVSEQLDSRAALSQHLPANLLQRIARNHVYDSQAESLGQSSPSELLKNPAATKSPNTSCQATLKIGMIDTDIQLAHPALLNQNIIAKNFIKQNLDLPKGHGTVIAGVLKAKSETVEGRLPNATLYAASVFYSRNDYTQGATLVHLIDALEWLSDSQVKVINMSLTGPHNLVLQRVIQAANKQQIAIVAAAGNQGPAAPALYPAAYSSVIAVSAVDHTKQIYRWANQGAYIDFVALGVAVPAINAGGNYSIESGTSLAAPIVTAALACELNQSGNKSAIKNLMAKAVDLGESGHDLVFGYGLIE